jgi:hypothetical protein
MGGGSFLERRDMFVLGPAKTALSGVILVPNQQVLPLVIERQSRLNNSGKCLQSMNM